MTGSMMANFAIIASSFLPAQLQWPLPAALGIAALVIALRRGLARYERRRSMDKYLGPRLTRFLNRFHAIIMNDVKPIAHWLLLCCAMIFAMAVIGAVTRLTESGLSITEWAPIAGIMPPLNDAAWQQAFAAYQKIPQYQMLNQGMSLDNFKAIYFWEWLHRLWGRLIGVVYALPFFYFLLRRKISPDMTGKLWLGLVLGGCKAPSDGSWWQAA